MNEYNKLETHLVVKEGSIAASSRSKQILEDSKANLQSNSQRSQNVDPAFAFVTSKKSNPCQEVREESPQDNEGVPEVTQPPKEEEEKLPEQPLQVPVSLPEVQVVVEKVDEPASL
jgi:hypothetical protein